MYVGKRMSREVVTASPDMTLKRASHILMEYGLHHLPVVEGDNLVGLVTNTDIRNSTFEETVLDGEAEFTVRNRTVGDIMTRDPVTIQPWDTIEDALLTLHKWKFSAIPVVEGKNLVGIISKTDILAALVETLHIEGLGVRIEVLLPSGVNSLSKLLALLSRLELEVKSLIFAPHGEKNVAFIRIETIDVDSVKKTIEKDGFEVPELSDFLQ